MSSRSDNAERWRPLAAPARLRAKPHLSRLTPQYTSDFTCGRSVSVASLYVFPSLSNHGFVFTCSVIP